MEHHEIQQPDYGTGHKKLSVYIAGLISCVVLTLIAFGAVMSQSFSYWATFTVIYVAALIQFFIQVICFLRLNTQTEQARTNVMAIVFTVVILLTIVAGSLWIMWSLNYYMMH
jgi:cytochrome o ubiquinol oxidase subunit IV